MSLKLPSSPAFYRCCLSHTGGWTHLFNPDLSFRHYEIVLSSFFFLPLPFFFPSPNSPLPNDIGLRQRFSSSCSTNFLTLFGATISFGPVSKPRCHVSLHRVEPRCLTRWLQRLVFYSGNSQNFYVKRLKRRYITS